MTITRRGDKYRVVCYGKRDPMTGNRLSRTATVTTYREAKQTEARFTQELAQGIAPAKGTLAEYLGTWADARTARVAVNTAARDAELVGTIKRHIGQVKLADVTPAMLEQLYATLLKAGRKDGSGGLHPRTVHHCHRTLHKALNDALRQGMIPNNPATLAEPPRVPHRPMLLPTDEQLAKALAALQQNRIWPSVYLMLCTGLRRGEALACTWSDLRGNKLTVTKSLMRSDGETLVKDVKRPSSRRTVILPADAVAMLREWEAEQKQEMLKRGYRNEGRFIMTNLRGEPMNPDAFTSAMRAISERAGARINPHLLRHGHATELLSAGVHPKIASARLGHSNISTTLNIYSHVVDDMQEGAADAAGSHAARLLKPK